MALFVVACGVLLMLGGAVSLLLGFDIVMTERGAAMTIGGVVALSGGVIAVGIGLALVRLNQILGALEARAAKPVRGGMSDRPVVPLASEEGRLPAAIAEPPAPGLAAPEPVAPPAAVRPPPVPAGGSLMPTVATAGLAAGAVALGAASVLGRSHTDGDAPVAEEPASKDASLADPDAHDEEPVPPPLPVPPMPVERPAEEEMTSETAPRSIALPLDLEEELSRALAETSVPPEPVTSPVMSAPPEEDRSFEDGLSKLLGRTGRPVALPSERAGPPDLVDLLEPTAPSVSPTPETTDSEALPDVPDLATIDPPVEEAPISLAPEQPEDADGDPLPEGDEILLEQPPQVETAPASAPPEPDPDGRNDDDIFNDVLAADERDGGGWSEPSMLDRTDADPASAPAPQSPVLGTYTIGGRTYRMFGDGSVEAVSEGGDIERFASMDELRKHLARA